MTPTARTLKWFRDQGWIACVVERWLPQARKRIDLFGWCDVVALQPHTGELVGVQVTSAANLVARLQKAQALAVFWSWCLGHRAEFHGWRRVGARGKRKLWNLRRLNQHGKVIQNAMIANNVPER